MLNTLHVFEHAGINAHSVLAAVQDVREKIDMAPDPLGSATKLVEELTGVKLTDVSADHARITAQRVAELIIRANHNVDNPEDLVAEGIKYADAFLADKSRSWMFAKSEETKQAVAEAVQTVVPGIETKVAVNNDGTIKKGGRQVLVAEMYRTYVLEAEAPLSNQAFIAKIVSDLKMTKSGATTYAYNVRKELGEPAGGMEKSARGRKAAA